MTPGEAKAQVMGLYRASAAVVGTDGWQSDGEWTDCTGHGKAPRASWDLFSQRRSALAQSPKAVITQVRRVWSDKGHRVKVVSDDNIHPARLVLSDPPYLSGSSPDGSLYQFTVGEDYSDFRATSACVPGDSYKLETGKKLAP